MPERPRHEVLSDREYQVMRLIAVGKSVKEIGFDLSLSVKTISTYRTRIMEKMKLKTNAEIIRYAVHQKTGGLSDFVRWLFTRPRLGVVQPFAILLFINYLRVEKFEGFNTNNSVTLPPPA